MENLENWLSLTPEIVLEPELPICDPHHHLWYGASENYVVEDLLRDLSGGHNIRQTVFIESRYMQRQSGPAHLRPVGETEFIVKVTGDLNQPRAAPAIAAGIISFADLSLGETVAEVIEAHLEAGGGRLRGIRYTTAWDPYLGIKPRFEMQPGMMAEKRFREGFAALGKYNLSFDAWLYQTQFAELSDLASSFPRISIIVDHVGGPLGVGRYADDRAANFAHWQRGVAELAAFPNVFMKLGGLGMRIGPFSWFENARPPGSEELALALAPYFSWCIEKFGPGRCMFESNFPVDKRSYSYGVLWNAFKLFSAKLTSAERRSLFQDTALKAYRLEAK